MTDRKFYHGRITAWILLGYLVGALVLPGTALSQDLTPSVNFFNFDYGNIAMSSTVDSIIAGRYEILVADGSYGSGYVSKYNELHALDPNMKFYVYLNFNDPYYSCAGQIPINEFVGPRMVADGQDSTTMYWHSLDYTSADHGAYQAYATSEMGSRLLTYNGTRALVNNTNLNFIHHFVDYAEQVANYHSGRNYEVAGLWFDNMNIPQTVGVGTGTSGRHIYESSLGGPINQYGAWTISDWQQAFKDTVLVKYMSILGDSLKNRLGLEVCINALTWAYGDKDSYAGGYQPEYFMGALVEPVHREFEYGISPYDHIESLLYPGPTNSASSINTSEIAEDYSPATIYAGQVDCSQHGVENWFNPGHGYLEYPFRTYWYDCLVTYYLIRSKTTLISFANVPETRLGVLNWLDGGASSGRCSPAGQPGDSCYWIDALGVRVGRDGMDGGWDSDVIDLYAASVSCPDCALQAGQGKDDDSQNWVVYRRRWTGDDGFQYMILLRTPGSYQDYWAGSHSPDFQLLDGPWQKLDDAGNWGAAQTTESFENGRGGIYRSGASDCASSSSVPTLATPANGSAVANLQPSLCINNSTPAAGCTDDQTYVFEVFSDAALTNRVAGPSSVTEGVSQSCFTVSPSLSSGRYYWWRARSYNGTAYSAWSGSRSFHTPNTAPASPSPVAPGDGSTIDNNQPALQVGSVTDPDGTTVTYRYELSTVSNFSTLVASTEVASQTSWTVPQVLANNTYYWRVCCMDGIDTSAWCSTQQFTVQVGVNNPPSLSMMGTPSDGATVTDSTPMLTIQNGTDPDNDDLLYFFELYDGSGVSLLASGSSIVEGGGGSTSWQVPITLDQGSSYRWRVRCYDGTVFSDWTSTSQFQVAQQEDCSVAPGAPGLSAPADGAGVGNLQPALCVTNSTPAPSCSEAQTYQFEVYSDSGMSTLIAGPLSASEGATTTCAAVSPSLQNGRWYWWRARSYNGTTYSNWTDLFAFHTPNTSPPVPTPLSPTHGGEVQTEQPTLAVGAVSDPDGTGVTYLFELSATSNFASLVASGSSPAQAWICNVSLSHGSTYYWRGRCFDEIAYSAYSSTRLFAVNLAGNQAPTVPDPYSPASGTVLTDTPIVVTVNNATDADGDPVYYDFFLCLDAGMTQLTDSIMDIPETQGRTGAAFFSDYLPINNQDYYWCAVAHDQSAWSGPSTPRWFRYFSFATDVDDYQTNTVSPPDGAKVADKQPTLCTANIGEPGDHQYFFDVSTDSSFVRQVASSPAIPQQSGQLTCWQVAEELQGGPVYYWRARADNYDYSALASFSLESAIYISPNPVSLAAGEDVTFHLSHELVDILIQTVSGETVVIKESVSGEWNWNGRNGDGNRVSPGVYLWYIRDSSARGKIVVKP